jgi:cytochrome c551/c552
MKSVLVAALVVACAAGSALAADGKALFLSHGCDKCHAVSTHDIAATAKSEKMRGPDLATVDITGDAAWIVQVVTKQTLLDGKKHKGTFKGDAADLRTIAEWIKGLKSE